MQPTRLMLLTLALTAGLPLAAHAEGARFLQRDPGCAQVATVQFLDCQVDVVLKCPPVDGESHPVFREEFRTEKGLSEVAIATWNSDLIELTNANGSFRVFAAPDHRRSTSFEALLKDGSGAFEKRETMVVAGIAKDIGVRLTLTATGDSVSLGSVTALVYAAQQSSDYPPPLGHTESSGLNYVLPDLRLVLGGESTSGPFYNPAKTPHRPMAIALPGEAGFDTIQPAFCGPSVG